MNKLKAKEDITDDWGNTIVPKGTILERQEGVYTGRNSLTGTRIQMDASWAHDEIYMESFTEVHE